MKITKQWIAKVAGWKANKAGKAIYERGAVLSSTIKEKIITGTIQSSPRPIRVTVKIHSEIDIDTVCPKMKCRRTGEICEHAVALMLHAISEEEENTTKLDQPLRETPHLPTSTVPLSIYLPPHITGSGMNIRLSRYEGAATSQDTALNQWLEKLSGQLAPGLIRLAGSDRVADFLSIIAHHPRVHCNDDIIQIGKNNTRIPMQMSRDEDRIQVTLCASILDNKNSWYADGNLFLWDADQHQLHILDVSSLWKPRYWLRLSEGLSTYIPLKEFLAQLEQQSELIQWEDESSIADIPISVATPRFELLLDGSIQKIQAKLVAHYSPNDSLTIGLMSQCDIQFPIIDATRPNHYLSRNQEAEDHAAGTLMQSGFQILDSEGGWKLTDEDSILEFLSATLPLLEQQSHWTIKSSSKLKSIGNNMVRIIPEFNFKETTSSGQDWLAFDVQFKTDQGKDIPKEVIQRMLTAGKRTGTSKNGKQVVISNFDADTVETVLRDTNPRQQNGLYYAQKNQAAYLRRLRQHYSQQQHKEPDLSIIKDLPEAIQETLRPYQEEGIAWLYERAKHDNAALLADDMGLGKTLQTLALLYLLKKNSKSASSAASLVVCPTSLLGNWDAEVKKFFPSLSTLVLHGSKRKEKFAHAMDADIIITSYALVARDSEFYHTRAFQTLVIDEASIIRNPDTKAAKALCKIESQQRIALTGTPVENAVLDLWSLYHFILPGYLGNRKDFQEFYEKPLSGTLPDSSTMKRLRMRVDPFILRRTKSTVAKDLPPKIHQTIYCEPTPSQQKTYAKLLRHGVEKVEQLDDGAARMQILTVLLRLRQASCDLRLLDPEIDLTAEEASSKVMRLLEMLEEAKQGSHRVLLFSQFTSMLGIIRAALETSNISYAYLDGATKDRTKEVAKFQSPTGPDVFLISLKAGGYGLNLTAADTVIHFDPWWNPAVEAQATDRAYRIGQTKPTTVYKLVTKNTVEEKILKLQEKKQGLISSALGDEAAPLMQGLSQSEIAGLLQ